METALKYPIALTPDDNNSFLVTCPDLPEVTSFGQSVAQALDHGKNAVEEAIAARLAQGADIPQQSRNSKYFVDIRLPL